VWPDQSVKPIVSTATSKSTLQSSAEDGHPEHSDLRAVVEFKIEPQNIGNDLKRTEKLLALIKNHPRKPSDALAFGYVIAGGVMFKGTKVFDHEREAVQTFGYGPVEARVFKESIPIEGYECFSGIVIGVQTTRIS
jgi:hypothetical protein